MFIAISAYINFHYRLQATQQSTSFRCIDGALRTTDPNEKVAEDDIPVSMFDEYIASPNADTPAHTNRDSKEQFRAFGIEAHPTRALTFDICYDFVCDRRRCYNGRKCVRVHPLDKQAYLATVMKEKDQYERMRAAAGKNDNRSVEKPPSGTSHAKSASTHETPHENIRVKLPPTNTHSADTAAPPTSTARQHRSTPSAPVASSSSSNDVQNWDTIVGLHPRQRSRSSSASGKSDRAARLSDPSDPRYWEVCTDESTWSDSSDSTTDPEAFRQNLEERRRQGTFMIATAPEDVEPPKLEAAVEGGDGAPLKAKHPRPRNSERCRRWLRNQCSLGYECRFIHEDLEYDDDEPPVGLFSLSWFRLAHYYFFRRICLLRYRWREDPTTTPPSCMTTCA
jgi:hypothetical protein